MMARADTCNKGPWQAAFAKAEAACASSSTLLSEEPAPISLASDAANMVTGADCEVTGGDSAKGHLIAQ